MRGWIIGGIVAAAVLSVAWIGVARVLERQIAQTLEAQAAAGVVAEHGEVDVTGYPLRWQAAIPDLRVAEQGYGWEGPGLDLAVPAFAPMFATVEFPDRHRLVTPAGTVEIVNDRLEAVVRVGLSPRIPLRRASVEVDAMALSAGGDWQTALTAMDGVVSHAPQDGAANRYLATLRADTLVPSPAVRDRLDPAGALPEQMEGVTAEAVILLDRPLDRRAAAVPPQPVRIDLTDFRAAWGEMLVGAEGTLTVDADGVPSGVIAVTADNWRDMIGLAVNAGVLPPDWRRGVEGALQVLADQSGRPADLAVAITFEDGQVFFGPVPVGPAPRLTLR